MTTASTDQQIPTPKALTHIGALDGVRALSILFVLIAHTVPFGPASWKLNAMSGLLGMALFFCLSGFLIVSVLHRNANAITFFIKRVLRIIPPLAVYVLLMVLIFGIGWRAVLENALFVTNYFYDGRGRGEVAAPMTHLWSLSVEMNFYIAIGLAAALMGRRCVWLIPPAMLFITGLRIYEGSYINIATHLRVDEILSGGTLALISIHYGDTIRAALSRRSVAISVFILSCVTLIICCTLFAGPALYFRPYAAAFFVGVVIHCHIPKVHDLLESRPAVYLAKVSYALYIYHPLMVWGWMNSGSDLERYLLKRPISYVLAFGAAHISTFYWETRWQALAQRLTRSNRRI